MSVVSADPGESFELRFRAPNPLADGNYPGFAPRVVTENGLLIEYDVAVPMRDGLMLYVDVYRPAGSPVVDELPVIVGWSPYGKHGGRSNAPSRSPDSGVAPEWVSRYAAIEAPDPAFWCARGYAVVYADPRGTWGTPGDYTIASEQEAMDHYDLIEWCGTRSWSNGRVGLSGVSYLSIAQWRVAATRPPHLAAINPWEGLTDFYRDFACHGGIPETSFSTAFARHSLGYSLTRVEDLEQLMVEHRLDDAYWAAKGSDLAAVEVPAYVVASWSSHGLHSRGTLEGFKKISSPHKWLEVHGRKTWQYYYQPSSLENQRRFFDWALKGIANGWQRRPRVLLEVRERHNVGNFVAHQEWPPTQTSYTPLYLDASTGSLVDGLVLTTSVARYSATGGTTGEGDRACFEHVFSRPTEVTGHMKLRLWVEAVGADDADLFVALHKVDRAGEVVPFPFFALHDHGPVALGWLRASHRALDETRSTPWQPWHPHDREEPLPAGEPVPVEIEIWPSSTFFDTGERLRLTVQGHDYYQDVLPAHRDSRNAGTHVLHTGGPFDAHLLIPVVPPHVGAERPAR